MLYLKMASIIRRPQFSMIILADKVESMKHVYFCLGQQHSLSQISISYYLYSPWCIRFFSSVSPGVQGMQEGTNLLFLFVYTFAFCFFYILSLSIFFVNFLCLLCTFNAEILAPERLMTLPYIFKKKYSLIKLYSQQILNIFTNRKSKISWIKQISPLFKDTVFDKMIDNKRILQILHFATLLMWLDLTVFKKFKEPDANLLTPQPKISFQSNTKILAPNFIRLRYQLLLNLKT